MEIFAALSVCLLVLSALVVSLRTLKLWRRSRALPELLLSVMLLSATVIGYPLSVASTLIPVDEMWPLHVGSQLAFAVGYACLLFFTLRVFRPNTLWATCFAGFVLAVIAGATLAYAIEMTGENPRRPLEMIGLTMVNTVPIGVVYLWSSLEALLYHRRLALRLRLGLVEPVVVNRVLLWGLMSLSAGVAVVINGVAIVVMRTYMSPPVVLVSSILGLVHASCLFLAFHPPAWYRGWVEARHVAQGA